MGKRCKRYVRVGSFAQSAAAGSNRKRWSGRIGRRSIGRGAFRVTLVATDAAGNRSLAKRKTFRVVRR